MPISNQPDSQRERLEENVVTPWEESPLKTIWREVSEGRYPSVDTVRMIMSPSGKSLGELLVEHRRRR
jgi:hypothetical protein